MTRSILRTCRLRGSRTTMYWRHVRIWWLSFLLAGALRVTSAQSVHPVTGRHIAPVMGLNGADWLDREERGREEQPDKAILAFNLKPGMLVADVGAGTGFYSLRIAKAIAPGGIVYAEDIQPGMLEKLNANAAAQHVQNVV